MQTPENNKTTLQQQFSLEGKTALITGAGGLLGPKHAEAILECGGKVFLTDYNFEKVKIKGEELAKLFGADRIGVGVLDVANPESVKTFFDTIEGKVQIDILINNAAKDPKVKADGGLTPDSRFETMTYEYWQQGIDAIINGTFLCSQAAANHMLKNGGGVILNISSDLGIIAPDQRIYRKEGVAEDQQNVKPITYSAAKWAVIGMTKYLAVYFAEKNIRVNCLCPTGVYNNHPPEFVEKLSGIIPMRRMAHIDEYKGAIAYLCSNASSYATGTVLSVDGGKTAI